MAALVLVTRVRITFAHNFFSISFLLRQVMVRDTLGSLLIAHFKVYMTMVKI